MFNKKVAFWLLSGLLLVYFQIVIGGITRLTGSGLSITKWEIVTGTLPPLNGGQWQKEFDLYKATPQYQQINAGMSMREFKRIYFWEYLHRLWARSMGFIFVVPFLIFLAKGWLSRDLIRKLLVVVAMACLVAAFGWIMVASGLKDRPWVNAYKLSIHLCLALILYGYLWWIFLEYRFHSATRDMSNPLKWFIVLMAIQIFLGGLMSGMKAALLYPTFPDYDGFLFPQILLNAESWNVDNLTKYDQSALVPAIVQLLHRTFGYLLFLMGFILYFKQVSRARNRIITWAWHALALLLITQVILGISLLIGSVAYIPILLGVLHQAVAILLLTAAICLFYFTGSFRGQED